MGLFVRRPELSEQISRKIAESPELTIVACMQNLYDISVLLESVDFDVSITDAASMEDAARFRAHPDFTPGFVSTRFFLTEKVTPAQIIHGVHTGFDNYLLMDDPVEKWHMTIKDTMDGSSNLRNDRLWDIAGTPVDLSALHFHERPELEKEIVELLAEGLTNDQIAEILNISCQTVRNKVCRLMDDVGVSNRTLLSLAFRRSQVLWE